MNERPNEREAAMDEESQDEHFGFARVYAVELKYREKPVIDRAVLYAKVEQYTGKFDLPQDASAGKKQPERLAVWEPNESEDDSNMLMLFHLDYTVRYADGEMPSQTSLMPMDHRPVEEYATAIQQAWHWPDAESALRQTGHSLLLLDMMSAGLEPAERLDKLTGVLRAVLETAPCDAVYFRESDKLVEPNAYLAAVASGERLYGAMNVRFYQVEGTGSGRAEGLMDTLGLAALGIPDIQCHYYELEPNEVAGHLLNIGYYLFEKGDIIQDGETIGFSEDMRWRCEHQYALAQPRRAVLDLDPGEPHYAGRQAFSSEGSEAD